MLLFQNDFCLYSSAFIKQKWFLRENEGVLVTFKNCEIPYPKNAFGKFALSNRFCTYLNNIPFIFAFWLQFYASVII
jgi:hypothetical protein